MADVKRLVRRFAAGELMLSFIPEPEQRAWRMVTRGRLQLVRERVQLQNQIESLLEEGRIKLSSVISDLLGVSGRRILRAMASGQKNPETLAALGDQHLKCGREVLVDALTGWMGAIHCKLLTQHLDRIELIDRQVDELNKLSAAQMQKHQDAVTRLIEIPGIGAEAAQEIAAEIGPEAVAPRLCKLIWNILHQGARFIEFGEAINPKAVQRSINHHLKALRRLGYQIPMATAPTVATRG